AAALKRATVADLPKILVIATQRTPIAARISIALADVGFQVGAITPRGHPASQTCKIRRHFTFYRKLSSRSLSFAIRRWSPDLLVCSDDLAVKALQWLYHRSSRSKHAGRRYICDLVELSLGPACNFAMISEKSSLMAEANLGTVRTPKTTIIRAFEAFAVAP